MSLRTNEARVVDRAKADPEAFEALYERHLDRIYNYIYHRVGSTDDAEDLTSRTFHLALGSLPEYVDRGAPFSAWLYRIAHNLVANWHRDRSRRPAISLEAVQIGAESGQVGDGVAARALAAQEVRAAIRGLDADRQALLVLKFSEGLTNAEIGAVLGRSEGAVKSLYHRTLLALRDELTHVDGHSAEPTDARRN